jgi:phosphocarrier protein
MKECKVIIKSKNGIHARPARNIVKEADKYKSNISIFKNSKMGNVKSILSLLSLGLINGDEIIIRAEGEDEITAVDALVKLFESIVEAE